MGRIDYLHKLLVNREISCRELTEKYLGAIERDNTALGAYVFITHDEALGAADNADRRIADGDCEELLLGIPMALKDNISTRNIETTCCSKMLQNYKPLFDATVWQRLKSKGAVLLGKTNMDEFAMGSSCENSYFGPTANPYDITRTTGGSSGGSAAAVAGNLCAYALGSDTGGSVRQPASFCGLVGLKPTYGAVSRNGLIAFASSLDQIGPMCATVEDVSLVFDAVAGHDPLDSTLRYEYKADTYKGLDNDIKGKTIGIVREFMEEADEEVNSALNRAIKTFEDMGASVRYFDMPRLVYALPVYYILACAEASSNLGRYDGIRYGFKTDKSFDTIHEMMCKTRSEAFGDEVKRRILLGTFVLSHGYYDAYYKKAQALRGALVAEFDRVFKDCDVILAPTTPTTAFKLNRVISDPIKAYREDICTVPVNIAGLPAVSLCCGYSSSGLPVGMQLIGDKFSESVILNFAYKFQQSTDYVRTADWGLKL